MVANLQSCTKQNDLSVFSVDDEYVIDEGIVLQIGEYPVYEYSNELVVKVDLL